MLEKNINRARRAYVQCAGYPDSINLSVMDEDFRESAVRENCEETEPQDMLTDILHLCELCGFDFEAMLRMARNNYEAERDGMEEE